ncbi:serine hydrolase [Gemmobacter sp. 24YEA27]|uniref:serine hydrolase n=1 Tax=Gemmobacter sp. 24YEA27 TaxID=3040672 RepID=UPI0024B3577C|nr:serine hydrolase [Gemmobacter sp. 24YEA27]
MKRVDTIARERRAFYVQGWSMKKIVRELHVSRNTVRKILRTDETDFSYERERQPMPRIGPWQGQLEQFLSSNANKPARERLTLIRIFEELRGFGYQGGYDAVRRFARNWSQNRGAVTAEAYVPLYYAPGEAYGFFEPAEGPYHRAGVSDGMDLSDLTLDENVRRVGSVPLLFAPGTAWHYSLSTDVLGAVIEGAAGLPLPEAVRTFVTDPLGLTDTGFAVADPTRLAAAYTSEPGGARRMYQPSMKPRMDELERQKADIITRMAEAPADMPDVHPNVAANYSRNVVRFAEALNDPDGGREAAEASPR